STAVWFIVLGLCVACLGFFTAHSLTAASVSEQATHHKGSAASLYLVAYYIGVASGSTVLSPVWNAAGWVGLVSLAGLVPVIYLVFVTLMSKSLQRKRSEEHTSELQSRFDIVCRLLLEKKYNLYSL